MMNRNDILHKTTYVWKEDNGYAIIIKNDGGKAILNKLDSLIWKSINDEDTISDIIKINVEKYNLEEASVEQSIQRLLDADLITSEDLFWGDDIL